MKYHEKDETTSRFVTSDFYLTSFLLTKGINLLEIQPVNEKRSQFVLEENDRVEKLTSEFQFSKENSNSVLVDARKFLNTIKYLKDRLYQQERGHHGK